MSNPKPPKAPKRPKNFSFHDVTWTDPYWGLRDSGYPDVKDETILGYLNAENEYFNSALATHKSLQNQIFTELKGRIKEDDVSVPTKDGAFMYQWRFAEGAEYRTWWRWPVGEDQKKSLILDEPARAKDLDYYRVRDLAVSPDGRLLAWSEDINGSEQYKIHIRDLISGEKLADEIKMSSGSMVWANDSRTLFYTELDHNHRPYRVRAHRLGDDPAKDRIVFEEQDPSFFAGISKSASRDFIFIVSGRHETSEWRFIPADDPAATPEMIAARKPGHEYDVDHDGRRFVIRTNDAHRNFRLVTAPVDAPEPEQWRELIAPSDDTYIRHIAPFRDFLAIQQRVQGLDAILIRDYDGESRSIPFDETSYVAKLGSTPDFDATAIRLNYESMATPKTVFDYDVADRTLITRKVQEIPSGYSAGDYVTERLLAPGRDGTSIPISIVYKKGFKKDGSRPLHLYGYGAYGIGIMPSFSTARLSLLDRGFAYAIAHIRGGDELGRAWYEGGKMENRLNTFHDFIDCANHLIDQGFAGKGQISASGGSAGGTLMGYVVNAKPGLWRAIVAHVPFVDVLNTMLDDSLPLTPIEWTEWGNPIKDKKAFDFIRSYSPYDQVSAQNYPTMLITAGLNDPRVTYWEPAKWTARLRQLKTDDNLLLLKTNMGAGHGGKSGRFEYLHEIAEEYTFLLMAFDMAEVS